MYVIFRDNTTQYSLILRDRYIDYTFFPRDGIAGPSRSGTWYLADPIDWSYVEALILPTAN